MFSPGMTWAMYAKHVRYPAPTKWMARNADASLFVRWDMKHVDILLIIFVTGNLVEVCIHRLWSQRLQFCFNKAAQRTSRCHSLTLSRGEPEQEKVDNASALERRNRARMNALDGLQNWFREQPSPVKTEFGGNVTEWTEATEEIFPSSFAVESQSTKQCWIDGTDW
jgi:hypothetical protein